MFRYAVMVGTMLLGAVMAPGCAKKAATEAVSFEMSQVYGEWALDLVGEVAEMLRAIELGLSDPPPDDEAIRAAALSDEGMEMLQGVMLAQAFAGDEATKAFTHMAEDLRNLRLTITERSIRLKAAHIDEEMAFVVESAERGVIRLQLEAEDVEGNQSVELRLDRGELEFRELGEDAGSPMRFRRP